LSAQGKESFLYTSSAVKRGGGKEKGGREGSSFFGFSGKKLVEFDHLKKKYPSLCGDSFLEGEKGGKYTYLARP